MEQDTNLTYDSCKNCDRLEAEICRLEMIWETERGDNNRLKKENERLKQTPSPTGDRDCEELKNEIFLLKKDLLESLRVNVELTRRIAEL
jgi:predicted RNase H-like nuclease (RuvC/YqgF family)